MGPGEFLTAEGKVCYVSFDDNFRAWHEALPLPERLGVKAAFFTITTVLRGGTASAAIPPAVQNGKPLRLPA